MDFNICMDDMEQAITSFKKLHEQVLEQREKVCNVIAELSESGWSGSSQEAYLEQLAQWHLDMQELAEMLADLQEKLSANIGTVSELLEAGKALHLEVAS